MPAQFTKHRLQQRPVDDFALAYRLNVPLWVFDIESKRVVHANEAACELWQSKNEAELCQRDFGVDMSATVSKRLIQYQSDFIDGDSAFSELWTIYPNGKPVSVMVIFRGFVLPNGRMGMHCEVVGGAGRLPENLRSAEALLYTDVMITLFSKNGPPLYANPAARNMLDKKVKDFSRIFANPSDYLEVITDLDNYGEKRIIAEVNTLAGRRWFDLSAVTCTDAVTGEPAILLTAIDVSELKVARDTARYLADRDQLTGCFNRAYLRSHFERLASSSQQANFAIIFFDIDNFKQINDRHGHEVGDAVLQEVSTRIRNMIRSDDLIARLGGDEFAVLLSNMDNADAVLGKADQLRRGIARRINNEATRIEATVSMGIVLIAPDTVDFTTAMRQADIALYASKNGGRNRATFFSEDMGKAAAARNALEDDLRIGIENDQFLLHYQPRIDLSTGELVSVEGLVRWHHPDNGLIQPDVFIGVCEETGMIEDLGRIVLDLGCSQAIAWHTAGMRIGVSLNLSPRQFEDPDLYGHLLALSERPGFPHGFIELEITENVLVGEHEQIAARLAEITKLGYRIAIDDFGTGYSNLSYISQFPLDCIKIDRSFVKKLPDSGPLVGLILTLGQQIKATVVAEGIETKDQLDWLAANKCRQAQGYLLSKPLVADEIQHLVRERMTLVTLAP